MVPGQVVDPPALSKTLLDAIERRRVARRHPDIPPAVATRDARMALLADLAGYVWFQTRFHGLRAPGYAARLVCRARIGMYRAARTLVDVVGDAEERRLLASAVRRDDPDGYLKLAKVHGAGSGSGSPSPLSSRRQLGQLVGADT